MILRKRPCNKGEQFACHVKDVKRLFSSEPDDVKISFGYYHRNHEFSRLDYHHPEARGTVIASAGVNFRDCNRVGLKDYGTTYFISFYIIRDPLYTDEHRGIFISEILPAMFRWYSEMHIRSDASLPGSENMLIEWRKQEFITHTYRYH